LKLRSGKSKGGLYAATRHENASSRRKRMAKLGTKGKTTNKPQYAAIAKKV
jgi:hypothetical protein